MIFHDNVNLTDCMNINEVLLLILLQMLHYLYWLMNQKIDGQILYVIHQMIYFPQPL